MVYPALNNQIPRSVVIGNSSRGPYTLQDVSGNSIRVRLGSHLEIRRYSSTTDETGTALVLNTDYTINNTNVDSVTITLTSAQAVLTSSQRLVIGRKQTIPDVISLAQGANFSGPSLADAISVLTERQQELRKDVDRAVKVDWRETDELAIPLPPAVNDAYLFRAADGTIGQTETGDISTMAGLATEIAALYAIRDDITNVSSIDAEVVIVSDGMADVEIVADNISVVQSVAAALEDPGLGGALVISTNGGAAEIALADILGRIFTFEEEDELAGTSGHNCTAAIAATLAKLGLGDAIEVFPGRIYEFTDFQLPHVTDTNQPNVIFCRNGKATFKKISGGSTVYGIAPARWLSTHPNKANTSGPWEWSNIIFQFNNLPDYGFVRRNWRTRFFDCEFGGALVNTFLATRDSQDGITAGAYQSQCGWWRCIFVDDCSDALLKSAGTTASEADGPTDNWVVECSFNGGSVSNYGMWLSTLGGWHITGNHTYETASDDLYIRNLSRVGDLSGNTFEDRVTIQGVGFYNGVIGQNNYWEGVRVLFNNDTTTETLTINDGWHSADRSNVAHSVYTDTAQPNKTLILRNNRWLGATPVVRSGGTVIIDGGRDANGEIGYVIMSDGSTGAVRDAYQNSVSPANSDAVWLERQYGNDSGGNKTRYGAEDVIITDVTNGSEDSNRRFWQQVAGVDTNVLTLEPALMQQVAGGSTVGIIAVGEGAVGADFTRHSSGSSTDQPILQFSRTRNTIASPASVNQFDYLGRLAWSGYGGGALRSAARIEVSTLAATPSGTDMEARMDFLVTGAVSVTATAIGALRQATGLSIGGTSSSELVIDTSRGIRLRSYTDTELNSIAGAVNTTLKATGKCVWNSTIGKPVFAAGSTAGSVWKDAAGTTTNTPV